MALIKCPECGNEVSSFAPSCPKCGCPITTTVASPPSNTELQNQDTNKETAPQQPEEKFPEIPTVINVGKHRWGQPGGMLTGCYYLSDINFTNYIKEGSVTLYVHTNGIEIISGIEKFYISFAQLISLKFVPEEKITQENKSVIGRAVVGGLLLGPLAAVVGGMSGIGKKTKKLGSFLLVINFWDVYTRKIQTLLICCKKEDIDFLRLVEKEKAQRGTPEGDNYLCNILDENGKISDSKLIEALKIVGEGKLSVEVSRIEGCGPETAKQKVQSIGAKHNVNTSQFQSSGCMVTILIAIASIASMVFVACVS